MLLRTLFVTLFTGTRTESSYGNGIVQAANRCEHDAESGRFDGVSAEDLGVMASLFVKVAGAAEVHV